MVIISLVGPRAVGKTIIGKELASLTNYGVIDIDQLMLVKLKDQGEIFGYANKHGWNQYYNLVNSVLKQLFIDYKGKNLILDLGGGIIASKYSSSEKNGDLIKKNSKVILILPSSNDKVSIKTLLKREHARDQKTVNSWAKDWTVEKFNKKITDDFNLRLPMFKNYSDNIIYTRFKTPKRVAKNILKLIEK